MWIEINISAYSAMYSALGDQLGPHSSYTDMEGITFGKPGMCTEWGIRGCPMPLLKAESRKDSIEQEKWDTQYYVYSPDQEEINHQATD